MRAGKIIILLGCIAVAAVGLVLAVCFFNLHKMEKEKKLSQTTPAREASKAAFLAKRKQAEQVSDASDNEFKQEETLAETIPEDGKV